MDKERFEKLKTTLFMHGADAIEDFLGFSLDVMGVDPFNDKDVIDNLMDEVYDQMPDEELHLFEKKYLRERPNKQKYLIRMRITAAYKKIVEAEDFEEAKELAWEEGDFGDAFDIDGEFVSCEVVDD